MFRLAHLHRPLTGLVLPPVPLNRTVRRAGLGLILAALAAALAVLPLPAAFLLVAGGAFVGLVLVRPVLSLYALVPLIPFSPWFSVSLAGIRVGGMELTLALGLAAWLARRAAGIPDAVSQSRRGPGPLFLPFLVFLAGVSLSWLNMLSAGAALVETAKWLEMLALYLLVYTSLPTRQVRWLLLTLLLTGLAQAGLGLYQFIFKVGPEGFLLFGGRFLRAYGTFAQPNPYAGYLGLVLPLSLALTLWSFFDLLRAGPVVRPRRLLLTVALAGVSGILLAALLASQSRSGLLGFLAASAAVFLLYNRTTAGLVAAAAGAGALLLLAGSFEAGLPQLDASYRAVVARLVDAASIFTITDVATIEVTDANFAVVERLAHWQAAREMWRDHLWLGVGFGNYAAVYPAYAIGRWLDPLGHAHNYLLNIGAEAGLVGISTYLIFWILVFGVLWQAVRRARGLSRAVVVGAAGVFVHLHVQNFFDNLYVQGMYLHIAILLALVAIVYKEPRFEE